MAIHIAEDILLASGSRTTTQTLGPYNNPDIDGTLFGIEVVLNLTAFVTAASLTLSIEEFEETAGAYVSVLAATALTGNGVARLLISPVSPTTANVSKTGIVAKRFRVVVTHGNANSHTYGVSIKQLYER